MLILQNIHRLLSNFHQDENEGKSERILFIYAQKKMDKRVRLFRINCAIRSYKQWKENQISF